MKRAKIFAAADLAFSRLRLSARQVFGYRCVRDQQRIEPANPLETKLGQFDRRDFLAAYLGSEFGDRHPLDISFGHLFTCLRETIGSGMTPSSPVDEKLLEQHVGFLGLFSDALDLFLVQSQSILLADLSDRFLHDAPFICTLVSTSVFT